MIAEDEPRGDDELLDGAVVPSGTSRVRDVLVCAAEGSESVTTEEWEAHPPIGAPRSLFPNAVSEVDLGEGIRLLSLPNKEAEEVVRACTPRGMNFDPARQFGQQYSFVRERTLEEIDGHDSYFNPDEDGKLYDALTLSRLIRDNGFSLQYTARVIDHGDGRRTIAYRASSEGNAAYRLGPGREWLDGAEAGELRALLDAHRTAELPPRVQRAMWRSEYATRLAWANVMLPTIIGGLEALLKIGRGYPTRQFKVRSTALAAELGIVGVDEDLCAEMYDGRSDWVHGSHVKLFGREGAGAPDDSEAQRVLGQIATMRDLLRAAIRRSIEDSDFRAIFASVPAIERRWPVTPPRRGVCARIQRRLPWAGARP